MNIHFNWLFVPIVLSVMALLFLGLAWRNTRPGRDGWGAGLLELVFMFACIGMAITFILGHYA